MSLGTDTQSTDFVTIVPKGFSGWMYQTFTYTATSSSEVLTFQANGTGIPPFALLDGVTMNVVPEPSTLPLMALGLLCLAVGRRIRRVRASAA